MRQLREAVDDAFGNTVREVIGVWITVLIVKRQHRDRFCRQLSALFRTCVTTEKKDAHRDRSGDDHDVNPCAITRCFFRQFVRKLRSLQAFWRQLEGPCDHERDRKTDHNEQHDEPNPPIRNLKKRKILRRDLNEQPRDNRVSNRNFVNVAPLHFGKEFPRVHGEDPFFGAKTFATSSSNRGSPRSGSSNGSTLMYLRASPARS